jgi:transcription termination/antitermination protein NusG
VTAGTHGKERTRQAARPTVQWHACYTKARHEKQVERMLRERGISTFLPLVPRISQWRDRRKLVEWPLFPSYVFGRFDTTQTHEVLSIPGLTAVVSAGGRPIPIPDEDLENVRRFARGLCSAGAAAERRPFFAEGVPVQVVAGPFKGVRGIVVEQRGRRRVLIGLKAIGQALEIDIDARLLTSVGEHRPRDPGTEP